MRPWIGLVGLLFVITACGGSTEREAELERRVAELEAQVAALTSTTGTPIRDVTVHLNLINPRATDANFIQGSLACQGVRECCEGRGRFDDVKAQDQVILEDEDGTRLGVAQLGFGTVLVPEDVGARYRRPFCRFTMTFRDVPETRAFYTIVTQLRGSITFERDEFLFGAPTVVLGDD